MTSPVAGDKGILFEAVCQAKGSNVLKLASASYYNENDSVFTGAEPTTVLDSNSNNTPTLAVS